MSVKYTDSEAARPQLPEQADQRFETLYNQYMGKVYKQCLSMTKDSEQAQDFTQDIFLKVFTKLDAFQQRSTISTWLYSIAYNHCADQLRLAKRLKTTPLEAGTGWDLADADEEGLCAETLQAMDKVMDSLTEEERSLLTLKYEKSTSIEEIARSYGLKTSAVKMRLKRCREKVHRLYAEQL